MMLLMRSATTVRPPVKPTDRVQVRSMSGKKYPYFRGAADRRCHRGSPSQLLLERSTGQIIQIDPSQNRVVLEAVGTRRTRA